MQVSLSQLQIPTGEADSDQSFEWKGCFMISSAKKQTQNKIWEYCGTNSSLISSQCNSYSQKIAWYNTNAWKATCISMWTLVLTCMAKDMYGQELETWRILRHLFQGISTLLIRWLSPGVPFLGNISIRNAALYPALCKPDRFPPMPGPQIRGLKGSYLKSLVYLTPY